MPERISKQHPRNPTEAGASFIYDPEVEALEPPEHVTAIPEEPKAGFYGLVMRLEARFERLLFVAIVLAGIGLTGLMFTQVLLRYVFLSPFVGIEELALLLGAWGYFLGLAYVTRNGEHIHGGIVTLLTKDPQVVQGIRLFMSLASIVACVIFGYYASRYAVFEIEKGRMSSYMRWPKGLWSSSMIVGFAGTIFYLVLQALNQFVELRRSAGAREVTS
ncbi:TRAP transporter small permease [Roseibium sp. SCP14]|uniref:TRAP transporter small permease n=1 Tax=Roseibium sp. SCP14 TaxID=3141375 RepID=UPI00333725DB